MKNEEVRGCPKVSATNDNDKEHLSLYKNQRVTCIILLSKGIREYVSLKYALRVPAHFRPRFLQLALVILSNSRTNPHSRAQDAILQWELPLRCLQIHHQDSRTHLIQRIQLQYLFQGRLLYKWVSPGAGYFTLEKVTLLLNSRTLDENFR
jgi:hypothetical protein